LVGIGVRRKRDFLRWRIWLPMVVVNAIFWGIILQNKSSMFVLGASSAALVLVYFILSEASD